MMLLFHFLLIRGLHRLVTGDYGVWNKVVRGEINAQILITGSSRALCGIDCRPVSAAVNKSCYNIGLNGVRINLQLPMLKIYLKHNKTPSLIIQTVDIISLNYLNEIIRPERYIPFLNEDEIYYALCSIDKSFWRNRHLPLYSFAKYGTELSSPALKGLFGINKGLGITLINGFYPKDIEWNNDFENFKKNNPKGVEYKIDEKCIKYLESIIELAKSKGIDIVLAYMPEYSENIHYTKNRDEIFNIYRKTARTQNIEFWDFSGLPMAGSTDYFYNSQHLNRKGAEQFSKALAERLREYLMDERR